MNLISRDDFPPDAQIIGSLRDDFKIADMDEDVLLVELANRYAIDVSWTPKFDPDGSFKIVVFSGDWEKVERTLWVKSPTQAAQYVKELSAFYNESRVIILSKRITNLTNANISQHKTSETYYQEVA